MKLWPPSTDPGALNPPPELAERLVVEDWIDVATFVPRSVEDDGPEGLYWAFWFAARRLWKASRAEWLAAHDVPKDRACAVIPVRSPTYRDEAAVRATIERRLREGASSSWRRA